MRIRWEDLSHHHLIGSGSFGRVFQGDLLGTEVAIKECVRSDSRAFDEKYFKREVDILKQSRHPNIVQFMGICKRRKRFYIITEFLPMGNLRRWIQDDNQEFGWDTRISFAIDISLALAYLHHKNIIHRDLKGENLLISENMRIKVCDFGFSRVAARDDDEMRRISYCGTDGYMAPEILLGDDFDCSVDVFSFGVVLAEMMARHVVDSQHFQRLPPEMTLSPDEILFRAQPGCPMELGELAIHCIQPFPSNRPQLSQIVARLTAIENVDIHVGTTLVVAPSVARAARNMMRRKEAAAAVGTLPTALDPSLSPHSPRDDPAGAYPSSSLLGTTDPWRRTAPQSSTQIAVPESHSTYRGRSWSGSSRLPLVMDKRHRRGHSSSNLYTGDEEQGQSPYEDETTFRMPRWDSVNAAPRPWKASEDLVEGRENWQEADSTATARPQYRVQTDEGVGSTMADDAKRLQPGNDFSSDEDRFDDEGSEDELGEALFDDEADSDGDDITHSTALDYTLSSDSDGSSIGSLTESVVVALDTLEIPKLAMDKLPSDAARAMPSCQPPVETPLGDFSETPSQALEDSFKLYRSPSLISRLLPPIPDSENPWDASPAMSSTVLEVGAGDVKTLGQSSSGVTLDSLYPPAPPSKTSLLLRTDTWRARLQVEVGIEAASVKTTGIIHELATAGHTSPLDAIFTEPMAAPSTKTHSSISSLSSSPSSVHSKKNETGFTKESNPSSAEDEFRLDTTQHAKGKDRERGLVRGLSDSFLGQSSSPQDKGGIATVTEHLAGVMLAGINAKTWAGGTSFGQWLIQQTPPQSTETDADTSDKASPPQQQQLRKHSSLKDTKPKSSKNKALLSDSITEDSQDNDNVDDQVGAPGMTPVKKRARKPLTGISHRFSLVIFSALVQPKCDVCLKRLGMLPGWSSKHLECDDCGYRTHPKCVANVSKCCTSARKSGVWDLPF